MFDSTLERLPCNEMKLANKKLLVHLMVEKNSPLLCVSPRATVSSDGSQVKLCHKLVASDDGREARSLVSANRFRDIAAMEAAVSTEDRRQQQQQQNWHVPASRFSKKTFNPIRSIIESMDIAPNPEKPMIALSIGDPTVFGNLGPPEEAIDAIVDTVRGAAFNGYAPSTGAKKILNPTNSKKKCAGIIQQKKQWPRTALSSSTDSKLGALDLCISVLCDPGQNLLVPRPGFPLYQTLSEGLGIQTKHYRLLPERGWEVDLEDVAALVDDNTAAILINNPSNPCGSVFSRQHLQQILELAERFRLPIIADEIYDRFVFPGEPGNENKFYPLSSLTNTVPILSCGGLTKRFMVPGWRMGWILVCDRNGILNDVRHGLQSLSQRTIGSNTIVQGALPKIVAETPPDFFDEAIAQVQENAAVSFEYLASVPGLRPVKPSGAMYMMVGIDMEQFPEFTSDLHFVERLVAEQSVFCLPGKCFNVDNYVRVVLTVPLEQMREACVRIAEFCATHRHSHPPLPPGPLKN
ncbi:unnamed protein product [Notodromas monacha]|uniref:Tyrosine aminotransferase n=1 Tax=Notodromas monacha TaxID=399045 RepID=A0A7R9BN74_9CRUS|nr:unnamed protein product [Notodromas monacha]CAG0917235.1 unnamed protein product [Notodromas monacha]